MILHTRHIIIGIIGCILLCTNTLVSAQSCDCAAFDQSYIERHERYFRADRFDSALHIARKLQTQGNCCEAISHILQANSYLELKKPDSVLTHVSLAEKKLGKVYDTLVSPEILRLRGMVAADKTKPEEAAAYYIQGLEQSKAHKNTGYAIKFCNEVSLTFASINQPEKSIEYIREGYAMAMDYHDASLRAMMSANMVVCYGMLLEKTKDKRYLDSLEYTAPVAIQYAKEANSPVYIIRGYNTMAGIALEKQDFSNAVAYTDTVIQNLPPAGGEQLLLSAKYRQGQALLGLHQPEKALPVLEEALQLAEVFKNAGITSLIIQQLYLAHKELGNSREALNYFERHVTIRDSLTNAEKSAVINELEQKYNKAQNEQTIRELNQEKQINTLQIRLLAGGILLALLIALSVFLFYRQKNLQIKKRILETEQRLNRARMNPHFFFNALATLQGFALRENDGKALASNLGKFSRIMRETLESTYKDYVTIEQEMQFLGEYLELQKIRFPQSFSYRMSAAAVEDIDLLLIPSMIIQPFVENSIEHGFRGIDYPGEVDILFDQDETHVLVTILDNGKGLSGAGTTNNEHISRASQIIRDRIYLLNLKLKSDARFEIANQPDGRGVHVTIRLPKIYQHESTDH